MAALLATMVGYALLVPTYRNPDEHNHVDLALGLRQANRYPDYHQARLSWPLEASIKWARWSGRGPSFGRVLDEEAPTRDLRPSFDRLPAGSSPSRNQVANHPFLYYLLTGKALAAAERLWPGAEPWPYDRTVVVLRLLGALLVATLPLLAFAAARRLRAAPAVCLAAALLPLANPQLVRQGASVNNDSLLVVLAAALTVLLVRVWTGDRSPATAALVGLVLGLALLTKGFALALVPWVALAYARAWWRGPRRPAALGGALALGLAALVGGWWWLRNLLVFGTVQTELENRWRLRQFDTDPAGWARRFAGRVTASFWGFFGQLEVPLDRLVVLAPIVLATAVTVVGIAAAVRQRGGPWTGGTVPFLLWPIAGTLVILVPGAYRIYAESSLWCCMHGRYLLPGLTALAVVVAVGLGRLAGRRRHLLPVAVLALGGLLHGVALPSLLLVHYGPPDADLGERLAAVAAWAPWPAPAEAVLLAACLLVVMLVGARVAWVGRAGTLPLSGLPAPAGGPSARAAVTTGDRQKETA